MCLLDRKDKGISKRKERRGKKKEKGRRKS
jgi:hypothetical protein